MSSSISAAIKRRAGSNVVKQPMSEPSFSTINRAPSNYDANSFNSYQTGGQPFHNQNNNDQKGQNGAPLFTLQQALLLIDKRITTIEQLQKEAVVPSGVSDELNKELESISNSFAEITSEFDSRYNMLANEIVSLKNTVMSLQSYTMDVNKMLLEERVRILSEISEPAPSNM